MNQSPKVSPAYVVIEGDLPPHFDGLVACYPQQLFKPRRVVTEEGGAEVSIMIGGRAFPCDGKTYDLDYASATSLGDFVAFHVRSTRAEPQRLRLKVSGVSADFDGGDRAIGRGFVGGVVMRSAGLVRE